MSFTAGGPQPTAGIERIPPTLDSEKAPHKIGHTGSDGTPSQPDADTNEYDIDGEKVQDFQKGVERIRVITTIWSKPTLISMFVL
jgi:hypothetical protein